MTTLTSAELSQLTAMRAQARSDALVGIKSYYKVYETLAGWLTDRYSVASTDSAVLWLRGATEANAGRGAFSALIRSYTETQYQLRYATPLPAGKMQEASNEVAENLIKDLLGESNDWPRALVPDITRIARSDATGVGRVLFSADLGHDETDTAFTRNAAWSGSLLFSLLRSDQTDRLMNGGGDSKKIDTLNAWRDVLYAQVSYSKGLQAAFTAYWAGSGDQKDRDFKTLDQTITGYLLSSGDATSLLSAVTNGTPNPTLKAAFKVVGDAGANKFLDMLMGAVQGKPLLGTTTDANFATTAKAFLGALTPAELQRISASLMPTGASAIAELAKTDVNARSALVALSLVKVQVSNAVASQLGRFDASTNTGGLTDTWLADRAGMLQTIANTRSGQNATGASNTNYFDASSNTTVVQRINGAGANAPANTISFGGEQNDTLNGTDNTKGDRLYGGLGNDTLDGKGGNDYLEGGAGQDTYIVDANGGQDTIVDADGLGQVRFAGRTLSGAGTLISDSAAQAIWQDTSQPDAVIDYVWDKTRQALRISGGGAAGAGSSLVIQNYSASLPNTGTATLGITAPAAQPMASPPASSTVDVSTSQGWQDYTRQVDAQGNTTQASLPARGAVYVTGAASLTAATANQNLLGSQQGDVIEGGALVSDNPNYAPSAHTLHGLGGADYIYAVTQQTVGQAVANSLTYSNIPTDAQLSPTVQALNLYAQATTLDGGAGNDTLIGSALNDVIYGGDGNDTIVGGQGDDIIMSDGDAALTSLASRNMIVGNNALADDLSGGTYSALGASQIYGYQLSNGASPGAAQGAGVNETRLLTGTAFTSVSYNPNTANVAGGGVVSDGVNPLGSYDFTGLAALQGLPIAVANWGSILPEARDGNATLTVNSNTVSFAIKLPSWYGLSSTDPQNNPQLNPIYAFNTNRHSGDDVVYAGSGNDTVNAGGGNDVVLAGQGVDYVAGYSGDDLIFGEDGNDYLWGDEAVHTASGLGRNIADLWTGVQYASAGLLGNAYGQDYLDGGAGNDVLVGGGNADVLYGGAGDDLLYGDDPNPGLTAQYQGNDYLDGGAGDDYLEGGGGNDTLLGGAGKDVLWGDTDTDVLGSSLHGDDTLDGGDGDDQLVGNGGADILLGGAGDDLLRGDSPNEQLPVDAVFQGNDYLDGGAGNDQLYGDGGNDTLIGGTGNDTLVGGDGDDTISAGGGNDTLIGGTGRSLLDGGEGDDGYVFKKGDGFAQITDTSGINTLFLGPGITVDDIEFSLGSLKITTGQAGDEIHLEGFDPNDPLNTCAITKIVFEGMDGRLYNLPELLQTKGFDLKGTPDADYLVGTALNDRINGGASDDYLDGGEGNNTLRGEAGDDTLVSAAGADSLDGGDGNDYLDGGQGNDMLAGGAGNDTLVSGAGADLLDGGDDDDVYVVSTSAGSTTLVDMSGNDRLVLDWLITDVRADAETLTLTNTATGQSITLPGVDGTGNQDISAIESFELRAADGSSVTKTWDELFFSRAAIVGTNGTDTLAGTAGDDLLIGLSGNDTMTGGDGSDTFRPGTGSDRMDGGAGDDTYVVRNTTGNKVIADAQGADTLVLGWLASDLSFDVQDSAFVNTRTGQRVKIEGFDVTQSIAACPIEAIELDDGAGGAAVLTTQDFFSRIFDVDGTPLADVIHGSALRDRIYALESDDIVNAGAGDDYVYGGDGNDTIDGGTGDDMLSGDAGNDTIRGGQGDDGIFGSHGDDVIDGGPGNDTAYGGSGADTYYVDSLQVKAIDMLARWTGSANGTMAPVLVGNELDTVCASVSFTLGQGIDNLVMTGNAAIDATGNWLANTIVGNDADNVIIGSGLNRRDDKYGDGYEYALTNSLYERITPGSSSEERTYDLAKRAAFQNRLGSGDNGSLLNPDGSEANKDLAPQRGDSLFGGGGNDRLYGDVDNDFLDGGLGDDLLVSGGGNDIMRGGFGNDTYVINPIRAVFLNGFKLVLPGTPDLIELAGEGTDAVLSSINWTLGNFFENLTLLDSTAAYEDPSSVYADQDYYYTVAPINGVGNALENVISGNRKNNYLEGMAGNDTLLGHDGNDLLDGGAGDDTMDGGQGDDTYIVESLGDVIVEQADSGMDTVVTIFDTLLQANVENLTLAIGSLAVTGLGNELSNTITGNQNDNVLDGGVDGNDVLFGGAGNDILRIAEAGVLYGDEGDDTLIAGNGDNTLDGGTGADLMDGGQGSDIYIVDNVGDVASEAANNVGTDTVISSLSLTLGASIENLTLTGNEAVIGIGNELNNVIYGADNNNLLVGGLGDDALYGGRGNDELLGGNGNDILDGGDDVDLMVGGLGDDTYYVDYTADSIVEEASGGRDRVVTTATYTLSANVEDVELVSTTSYGPSFDLTGNALDNLMNGNVGYNTLRGLDGNDVIDGQAGKDTLYGGAGNDYLYGGGDASVRGSYGGAVLLANDDYLYGEDGSDTLDGGSGNDFLYGGTGDDKLYGGDDRVSLNTTFDGAGYGGYVGVLANDDYLDGGLGIDEMRGGTGNDTYVADGTAVVNAQGGTGRVNLCDEENRFGADHAARRTWTTDTVIEVDGEGFDVVNSRASINLVGQSIEVVNLLGDGEVLDIDAATGSGDQTLNGNSGNNRLDGGAGADVMTGGAGDDTYVVDDAGDVIVENAGEGFDTVRTTLGNYALAANFEGLVLEGSANLNGFGNDANNSLIGNTGNNVLEGGGGDDTLAGWRGDDILRGGTGKDTYAVSRGDGHDMIEDLEGNGVLHFSGDINRNDLRYSVNGNDLVITVANGDPVRGAQVTLRGWMGAIERVNQLAFCGGDTLLLNESVLNRAPIAIADTAHMTEDAAILASGNVLANDSDPDSGDVLSVTNGGTYQGLYGVLQLQSNGSYSYALNNTSTTIQSLAVGETLSESFVYNITDSNPQPLTARSTLTIAIHGTNDGPVAVADTNAVQEDVLLTATGNVLANDSDIDRSDVISVSNAGVYAGQYGALTLGASGAYSYALNNGANVVQALDAGQQVNDVFDYAIRDNNGGVASSRLAIKVTGSNDGPTTSADIAALREDAVAIATGNVLANDRDIDATDILRVANPRNAQGTYGNLTLAADGSYSYALNNGAANVQSLRAGQQVTDSFAYVATDGLATSANNLTVTVTGTNDGPVASADTAAVQEDTTIVAAGNVLTSDSDLDNGDVLTVSNAGTYVGRYGSLTLAASGAYSYSLNNASTEVQSLAATQQVSDVFAYAISDGNGGVANSQLTIKVVGSNDGPVVVADVASLKEDTVTTFSGNVLANDSDKDTGDVLSLSNAGTYQGTYGSLVLRADGSYTYTLANSTAAVQSLGQGDQVTDSFNYTVKDNASVGAQTAQASLVVTIAGTNDGPTLNKPIADVTLRAKTVLTLDLPDDTFKDIDRNDVLGYSVALSNGQALPSWLSFNPVGLVFTGTPPKDTGGTNIDVRLTVVDRFGATTNDVFKISITSCVGLTLNGGCGNDRLVGAACDDTIDGKQGADTMIGGDGDDTYYVDQRSAGCSAGDVVTEYLNQGYDKVIASTSYVLPQHVEALFLASGACIDGTGNTLDNWLVGNSSANTLDGKEGNDLISAGAGDDCVYGGAGNDILEGQDGNDTLEGGDGVDAVFGGAGNDTLRSNAGKGLLAGGKGNDNLHAGTDTTEIAFNRGDGNDVLYAQAGKALVLSLGGGIRYDDIKIRRSGNNLIADFNTAKTDSITISNYYAMSASQRPAIRMQMLTEASGAYAPGGTNVMLDNRVEQFDFSRLVGNFDQTYAASSSLRNGNQWAVMNSLLSAHLGGSNTAALGGDLAYQYGNTGGVTGMGMEVGMAALADTGFASSVQTLRPKLAASAGSPALVG